MIMIMNALHHKILKLIHELPSETHTFLRCYGFLRSHGDTARSIWRKQGLMHQRLTVSMETSPPEIAHVVPSSKSTFSQPYMYKWGSENW